MAKDVFRNELENWPEKDSLPTGDPIGDTDNSEVRPQNIKIEMVTKDDGSIVPIKKGIYDPMEDHTLDALRYMSEMQKRVLVPEGKDFTLPDLRGKFLRELKIEYKCNCGTFAVHGNVPAAGHAPYCALRKK